MRSSTRKEAHFRRKVPDSGYGPYVTPNSIRGFFVTLTSGSALH